MRACTHGGWARWLRVSTTFVTREKLTNVSCAPDAGGVRTSEPPLFGSRNRRSIPTEPPGHPNIASPVISWSSQRLCPPFVRVGHILYTATNRSPILSSFLLSALQGAVATGRDCREGDSVRRDYCLSLPFTPGGNVCKQDCTSVFQHYVYSARSSRCWNAYKNIVSACPQCYLPANSKHCWANGHVEVSSFFPRYSVSSAHCNPRC